MKSSKSIRSTQRNQHGQFPCCSFWSINSDKVLFGTMREIGYYVRCIVWNIDMEKHLLSYNSI